MREHMHRFGALVNDERHRVGAIVHLVGEAWDSSGVSISLELAILDFFRPLLRVRGGQVKLAREMEMPRQQLDRIFDDDDPARLSLRHLDAYAKAHKMQASDLLRVLLHWTERLEQASEGEEGVFDAATAKRLSGAGAARAAGREPHGSQRR